MAEPDALARALDQPRHVGDRELAPVGRVDRAEHRRERRERVVGDLRLGVRDPAQERRLARVREAEERRVGEQLEPSSSSASSPAWPTSAKRGVCCVGVAKRRLPAPPSPPRATTARAPGCARSTSRPPPRRRPASRRARGARRPRRRRRACSSLRRARPRAARELLLAAEELRDRAGRGRRRATTSPPLPPSPPSGPPFGHVLLAPEAERAVAAAASPAPGCGRGRGTRATSTTETKRPRAAARGTTPCRRASRRSCGRGRGPRRCPAEARAALADDDHSRLDLLAVVDLDAEPLGLRSRGRSSRSRVLSCAPSTRSSPSRVFFAGVFFAVERAAACLPIDWISIRESRLRWPFRRR